jgi:hypothetical protein
VVFLYLFLEGIEDMKAKVIEKFNDSTVDYKLREVGETIEVTEKRCIKLEELRLVRRITEKEKEKETESKTKHDKS